MISPKSIVLSLAAVPFLIACDSSSESASDMSVNASPINVPVSSNAETEASVSESPAVVNAAPVQIQKTSASTIKHPPTKLGNLMNMGVKRNTFTTASSGLNPAHGMPGHDCSIPVGAPLASVQAPVPTSQSVNVPATASQPVTQPNFNVDPNVKLNPAHGQPGHDCSVAVGAPLPQAASANVKINPAHGQPGHDCSVAVGAPLPS
ncbi:hypothetical protein [Jiulongibacter sp. NS-SX5]|uniref:hypothetical protein n=1 Tax=Jiulongibacter sp. NS-SX5 TaxID=3463854 RepID=UPI0040590545